MLSLKNKLKNIGRSHFQVVGVSLLILLAVFLLCFNKIQLYVLDKDVRDLSDSMEAQIEQFTTQQRDVVIKNPQNEKKGEHKDEVRWKEPVESEDERKKMKNEPKVFTNLVIDKQKDLKIDSIRYIFAVF